MSGPFFILETCCWRLLWSALRGANHLLCDTSFSQMFFQYLLFLALVGSALVLFYPFTWEHTLNGFLKSVYSLGLCLSGISLQSSAQSYASASAMNILLYFFFILDLSIMMPFCTSFNWLTSSRTCSSCWTSSIWILDLTGSADLVAFHQFDLLSSCTYVPTSHQYVPVSQHLTWNLLSQAMSLEYPLPKVGWGSMQGLAWGSLVNESLAKIQNHKPIVLNKHEKVSLAKTLCLISCDKMQSWD